MREEIARLYRDEPGERYDVGHIGGRAATAGGTGRGAGRACYSPADEPALPPRTSGTRVSRVLVLDDDRDIGTTVAQILEFQGYAVECAQTVDEALTRIEAAPPDVILVDIRLAGPGSPGPAARESGATHPGGAADGVAFAEAYRQRSGPHAALVLFTALPDARELAERIGACAVVPKPFHVPQLIAVVTESAAGRSPRPE